MRWLLILATEEASRRAQLKNPIPYGRTYPSVSPQEGMCPQVIGGWEFPRNKELRDIFVIWNMCFKSTQSAELAFRLKRSPGCSI